MAHEWKDTRGEGWLGKLLQLRQQPQHQRAIRRQRPPQQAGTNQHPWPRGITRIRELLAAGVPVACGQDDIDNWFYPFGRNDLLEVPHFMAHNGQFA